MSEPCRQRPRGALSRASLMVAAALLGFGVSQAPQAKAANIYWDAANGSTAGTGGSGSWDTTSAFWSPTSEGTNASAIASFSSLDTAYFTGTAGTATLAGPITIGGLVFSGADFTIAGASQTLTLAAASGAPSISVTNGNIATLSTIVAGTSGLTKAGNGVLRLTNADNSYTGTTAIAGGTLVISSGSALGADTSPVSILTNNAVPSSTAMTGYGGGMMVLDGSVGGFTLARNIDFEGRGPLGDKSAAILSIGDNTLSGILTSSVSPLSPVTFRNSRINSFNGTLTMSGSVVVQGTTGTTFLTLGATNSAGAGDFNLTGALSGSGGIEKAGAGVLLLNPSSVSAFTGTVRVGGSATGQQSSIRVTQASVGGVSIFGANSGTGGSSVIDLNGGVLELLSSVDLNFNALTSGKNVYHRGSSTVYTGPAAGGSTIQGLTTFGAFRLAANTTATFNSRNGYGVTFQAWTQESSSNNSYITNNMGGNLTFVGDAWNNSDGSARVLGFRGTGISIITGSIDISGVGVKTLSKKGIGTWEVRGTATDIQGSVDIDNGALVITDFRSLANNTATINIGSNASNSGLNSTNNNGAGALIIGTTTAPSAAGLITSKVINLAGTTSGATIYANQSGASPVTLSAGITAAGAGIKTLTLGGLNAADNIISGVIPNNSATNTTGLTKQGSGVWVLSASNTYTGATTIQNGTLKLRATAAASDVVGSTGAVVFAADTVTQTAGGNLEFRGFLNANTTETLGALTPTAGAATVTLLGNGTGKADLTFTSLGATTAASSLNLVTTGANGGAITLTSQTATTATTLPGTANFLGHLYINGADFATINASAQVVAPTYGAAGDFREASSALVSAVHNKLTGGFTTATSAATTVSSLLTNSQTLTLGNNLVVSTGGILQSGGTATIQSNSATGRTIAGAAAVNMAIRVNSSGDILNLGTSSAPVTLASTTTGGFTKNGAGTLVVYGTNAQTGASTINEGTVRLSGSAARLSANGGTAAALVIRRGARLELDGVTAANATFNSNLDGAGVISNINAAAATLQIYGAGTWTGSFSEGAGAGKLSVTKGGTTGAPSWLGQQNYTGVTTIAGTTGSVTVDYLANGGVASGIGASTSDAANLVFSGTTGGLTYRGDTLDGSLTIGSRSATTDRLFTLAGTAVGSGATIASNATNNNALVWSNTEAIVFGAGASAQTLILGGSSTGDNTFNPQFTDNGANLSSLTKTGAGQWNLGNSSNSYTGQTRVQEGILALNAAGALPANSPLVLGNSTTAGTIQASGTFARDLVAAPVVGAGTITWGGTSAGGGFAAHATPLTVTLSSNATLTWASGGFVPTGGQLLLGSASALADVTFTNPINFGGVKRTITVVDNGNTAADFATLTGVLSGDAGVGGFQKAGSAPLRLTGANTYTGITDINASTLVVVSLGSSTGGPTSSVGAGGVPMTDTNAVAIGNASSSNAVLQHVGPGEVSDRKIRINATTGDSAGAQIHADGTGPLILTNVANDMVNNAAHKNLWLRGASPYVNQITSRLSDNGGQLRVNIDGGTSWVLTNGTNNYTGATTVGAGAFGIGGGLPAFVAVSSATTATAAVGVTSYEVGSTAGLLPGQAFSGTNVPAGSTIVSIDGPTSFTSSIAVVTTDVASGTTLAFAPAVLTISNGNVFAHGADRAYGGTLNLSNNTTSGFIGDYSLTFNGVNNAAAGDNNITVNNSIAAGKSVTFNGLTANSLSANRAWALEGSGETVINGNFSTSTTFGVRIDKGGDGTLVLGTSGATSNWNQSITAVDLDRGTLRFSVNEAIPSTAASGGLVISPEVLTSDIATVDLNGTTQTITSLTASTDGTVRIDNTSSNAAAFKFGANDSAVAFATGSGDYAIQNTGSGKLDIVKLGTSTVSLGAAVPVGNKGIIASQGGTFTIAGQVSAATGLSATGNSVLALTGEMTNPGLFTSVVVGGGSTLSLLNGAGGTMNLTTLNLGAGSGTAILNLNVGEAATDTLSLLAGGAATLANSIRINMTDAGLDGNKTYTLLSLADGGLAAFGASNVIQGGTPGGFTSMTWNVSDNAVTLTTGDLIVGSLYWRGGTSTAWNGDLNNWSEDKAGTVTPVSVPGAGTNVIFAWDGAAATALTTTLEQNFKVNKLVFEAGTTTPTSVAIDPGAVATNRLEIAPQVSTDGIEMKSAGPTTVTIGANLRIGTAQTWNVASSSGVLTLNGALLGGANVTKTGAGKVTLAAAADPAFNAADTMTFTVSGGTLELTNAGALGTAAAGNSASLVIAGSAFYLNNAASGTVSSPITLSGGVLSAGGASQTYSGAITVSADSFINLRDSNSAVLTTTNRAVYLTGPLSGSGDITLDSINTASSGNQLTGDLVISNSGNSGWSGDLIIRSGTVTARSGNGDAIGSGAIAIELGKLEWEGAGGVSYNISKPLTVARAGGYSVAEWTIDRTSGTGVFAVENSGSLTLGGAGGAGELRVFLADADGSASRFTGLVTLANNGAIHVRDNATLAEAVFSGGISEAGGARSLVINGPSVGGTAWGGTSGILELSGVGNYTGGTSLAGGTLRLGNKSALGSGALTVSGTSTIQASTVLTGANAVSNPLAFNASLTFSGNNSLELSGAANLGGAARSFTASGAAGATLTLSGAISNLATADGSALNLSGNSTGTGVISGGFTITGDSADAAINGGSWTHSGGTSRVGDDLTASAGASFSITGGRLDVRDDFVVTGAGTVLNLNFTGGLSFNTATLSGDASLLLRDGALVNLGANNAVVATEFDRLFVGQDADGLKPTLNMGAFNLTTSRLIVGERAATRIGDIIGTGTLTVAGGDIDLFKGLISANLGSTGTTALEKFGFDAMTLSGDNSALASTGSSVVYQGTLILDYSTNNATKLRALSPLDMRGAVLTLLGNASAATSQTVAGLTLANGGSNRISLTAGSGQNILLTLGAITRTAGQGTLRINLPSGTQSATNGVVTTTTVTNGTMPGYLTVSDGTTVTFAGKNADNALIAVASTTKTDLSTWSAADNVDNAGGAFSGTIAGPSSINTLTFASATTSSVSLASGASLGIISGGVLVTSAVSSGTHTITGGRLSSGITDLVFTHEGAAVLNVSSYIGGSNAVTKTGNGTLRLTNAGNTFTGSVNVQAGVLQVAGGNAIGDFAAVTLADDQASTFQLLANETIGAFSGGSADTNSLAGLLELGAYDLTINNGSADAIYAGTITGSGTITRSASSGIGNLLLRGTSGSGFTGALVVNAGLMWIETSATMDASSLTVNRGGAFMVSNNGTTRSSTRLPDAMPVTLNSADGVWNGQNFPSGLAIRTDQSATTNEQVGVLTLGSGASYFYGTANVSGTAIAGILVADIVRSEASTFAVRGRNLGLAAGQRNFLRIASGLTAENNFAAALVGGAGAAASKTISIVPWIIGETHDASSTTSAHMGNSLVTYAVAAGSGSGLRPLDLTTEYNTFATRAAATDNIRESRAADLAGLSGSTINALVLNNSSATAASVAFTGTGSGQALAVTSGTLLFTATAATSGSPAMGLTLGGFDGGITVGSTNEYVVFVQNPTSASGGGTVTATISSPLTSAADITKSGRGLLVLSSANTAGGGARRTTINEGVLQIDALDKIGGDTGELVLAGGTLKFAGVFDPSSRTVRFLQGGGTFDTNGNNITLASSVGGGAGGLTKSGNGILTLNAAANYAGPTNVSAGTLALGASNAIGSGALTVSGGAVLDLATFDASASSFSLSNAANSVTGSGTLTISGDAILNRGSVSALLAGTMNLVKQTASQVVTLSNVANSFTGYTHIQDGSLLVESVADAGTASPLGAPAGDNSTIRIGNSTATGTLSISATGSAGSTNRIISLDGTTGGALIDNDGTAGLILNGAIRGGEVGAKTLTIQGATTGFNNVVAGVISDGVATLSLAKAEAGTWILLGGNTYTGTTTVSAGVLKVGNGSTTGSLGAGAVAISSGASLVLDRSDAFAVANVFSGLGTLTVTGGNTYTLNGASTLTGGVIFSGSDITLGASQALGSLSGSSGNLALGGNVLTVSFATGTSTYPGNISGTGSIIKSLAGTQVLAGTNDFSGGITVTGGLISVSEDAKLGATSGPLVLNGGGLQVTGTTFTSWTASSPRTLTLSGAMTFDIADQANTFTLGVNAITAAGAFTKSGLGKLEVTNALTMGGNAFNVNAGTLVLQNGLTNATGGTFGVGGVANANAAFVQTGGTSLLGQADGDTIQVGNGGNAFGSFTIAGGTFQAPRLQPGGTVGTNNSGLISVLNGGTLKLTAYFIGGRQNSTNTGVVTIAGGTLDLASLATGSGTYGGGRFEVNLGADLGGANKGGTFDAGAKVLNAVTNTASSQGIINLLGGTLTTGSVAGLAGVTGLAQFNMNGGVLKAGATSTTFLSANLTAANVYAGGVTIDNNGFAITLAKPLTAPAGNGVASVAVTGASGYFTAPLVKLTGGGGNGDATAVAVLNEDGTINVVITNPGTGYASAPTVTLVGGTTGTAATASATLNSGNTSGGVTFQGSSTTTLTTDNSYAGTTTISGGALLISTSGGLGSTAGATIVASGASLRLVTNNFNLDENLTLSGTGIGTGSTYGALNFNRNTGIYGINGVVTLSGGAAINSYNAGTATLTFAQGIQGTDDLTLRASAANNGGAVYVINGASTYTGDTTLSTNAATSGVTLINGVTNALPATTVLRLLATSGTTTFGKYQLNGFSQEVAGLEGDVAANTLNSIVGGSVTLSALTVNNSGDYDFAGRLGNTGTNENNLALLKKGAGVLTLSGANTFSGGTTITGGTLAFSAANNLGDTSATNTLTLNGAVLSLTADSAVSLSANQVMTVGANGGTIHVAAASGSLALAGGITSAVAANLTKTGLGALTVTGPVNLNGGDVTVSAGVLQAGFTASGAGDVNVAAGATLNLYDGAATAMAITGLTLANGSALGFDLNGTGVNDSLSLTGSAVIAPSVSLNFNNLGGLSAGSYDLLSVTSGTLTAADYVLGVAPSGLNYNFTTVNSGQTLRLTTSLLNLVYWKGDASGSWSANSAADTNWASDLAGSTDLGALPLATDTLVFAATSAVGTALVTTLDGDTTADSLRFTANPSGVTSVAIGQGTSGTLTLSPASSNNGITVAANAGAITVGAPVATGAIQTWEVIGGGTNGSSLAVSGAVSIGHLINKTGAGALTLSGSNSGSGGINLVAGTLVIGHDSALGTGTFSIGAGATIDTGAGAIALAGNNVQNWNGNFIFTGTNTLNLGTGAVTLGDNVTLTAGNILTIGGTIADGASTFSLTKDGAGELALSGNNTYGGLTDLVNGALRLNGDNSAAAGGVTIATGATLNIGHANALGSGTLTINGGTLDNTSGANLTLGANIAQSWNGSFTFTGTKDVAAGSGAVTLGATPTVTVTAGILDVDGIIDDGLDTFGLAKAGAGTLSLGGVNTYKGATTLNQGALIYTADQVLTATTNTLTLGSSAGSTAAFSLELSGASANFGGAMLVQTSNDTANVITIGAGETLSVGRGVTVGYNSAANSTTKLNITGATGTFKVGDVGAPTNQGFQVGNGATSGISNAGTLDMSGLGTFYANLGSGTLRIGDPTNSGGGGSVDYGSSLILATDSTIIATTITSDSPTSNAIQRIKLGSGTNVLNANTITIGGAANRATGTLDFNASTGTVHVRALDGVGRTAMNVQNGSAGTGTSLSGTVDFNGHEANLLLSTLAVGGRSAAASANGTGAFSFDAGTLDATTVNIAARSGSASTTGNVTGTVNLGGGNATIGTVTMSTNSVALTTGSSTGDAISTLNISGGTTTIGTLTMGVNTVAAGFANGSNTSAIINITGGATTVSTTFAMGAQNSAINAATTVNSALSSLNISAGSLVLSGLTNLVMGATTLDANNAATASISITGTGSLTVGGNIQFTDGLGAETNTLTLDGGTLDLTGGSIGASAALITFNAQAGTLRNLAQLNGGGTLTKTTEGTLLLDTENAYTGATLISAGVLSAAHALALGASAGATSVTSGAELRLLGGIAIASEGLTLNGTGIASAGALRNFSGNNSFGGAITLATASRISSDAGTLTLTGGVTSADKNLTIGGDGDVTIDSTGLNLGAGSLTMSGTGTLLLSLANTYSGGTTISTGTVKIGTTGSLGSGAVSVAAAGTLDLNNLTVTNAITLASGATLTGGTLSVADAPKTGTLDVVLTGNTPLEKTDSGRLELTGDNTFTGVTSVSNGGTIAVADFGNGTTASPLGVTALTDPTKLVLASGATLEFTGTTATSTARSFTVSGSAGIAAGAGAAALTFTEDAKIALSGATPELKLVANNTGATNIFRASLSQADIDAGKGLAKLAIEGAGVWVIGGNVNRFKGDIRVDAAAGSTIGLESGALPAGATLALASGAKLRWEAGNTNDLSSNLSVATGATAKLDLGTNTVVFAGLQNVTGGATLQKEGAGTLKITSAVNAPNVNVTLPAGSGLLAVNGTVGNVSLANGSKLGGAGTVGNVTAGTGAIVSPGNSPGTLTSTSIALFGGSIFEWQIQDAKELTVNPGYDKLAISGALDLSNAASNDRITLKVVSLKGDGNGTELGNPLNFDKPGTVGLRPMTFDFATVGSLNLGANDSISDVFTIDVSQFKYSDGTASDAGLWSINWDSANHLVTVTAVPEPSTYGFGLGALALAAAAIRRRKRQAAKA